MAYIDPDAVIEASQDLQLAANAIAEIGGRAQAVIDGVADVGGDGPYARSNAELYARQLSSWADHAREHAVDYLESEAFMPTWPPEERLVARYSMFGLGDALLYQRPGAHRAGQGRHRPVHGQPRPRSGQHQAALDRRGRPTAQWQGRTPTWARVGGRALGWGATVWLGWESWNERSRLEEARDPNISDGDRRARATGTAVVTAGGALAGAALGAYIGTLLFPGVGTVAGALIGLGFSVAGAYVGAWVGEQFGDWGANAGQAVWDATQSVGDAVSDAWNSVFG